MNTNNLRKLALETNDGIMRGPALVAASEIDRLRSENERLTKERDEARAQVSASWIAGHAVGAGKGGCFAPNDLIDLIGEFGREVYHLLDDCETSGPVGEEIHTITEDGLRKVSAILDRIEAMPFEEPGVMLGAGAMLQAAVMQTFATPPAPQVTVADCIAALKAMPTRTEALGGQDFKYIQLGEALDTLRALAGDGK